MKVNIGNQEIPLVLNYNPSVLETLIDKKKTKRLATRTMSGGT